jgi:(p)ppGpp synthase/HD superfamily hydrolase
MESEIARTIALIQVLHDGQFDWTGAPYWQHPCAVMNLLPDGSQLERKLIALLHDVIEDCKEKIAELLKVPPESVTNEVAAQFLRDNGYCAWVVRGVTLLTRTKGVSYLDEIREIVASGHLDAMWVKYTDNTHNSDPERIAALTPEIKAKHRGMSRRYARSKTLLRRGILDRTAKLNNPVAHAQASRLGG